MKRIALIMMLMVSMTMAQTVSIADARADTLGDVVTIEGIITSPNFSLLSETRTDHTLQDATGAIKIFAYGFNKGLAVGDSVSVTGELDDYNGTLEIIPAGEADITIINSGNALPAFQSVTIAEMNANGEDYESELIVIDSCTIVSGTWPSGTSSVNLDIEDPTGETFTMRIDGDTDVHEYPQMLGYFKLQGVGGQYDSSEPKDSGYQIFPRSYSDFEQIGDPSPLISNVVHTPAGPTQIDEVTVTANIIDDSAVASASLSYTVDSGSEVVLPMTLDTDDVYMGTIPAQAANAVVSYSVSATDDAGGVSTSAGYNYVVYGGSVFTIASIQDGTIPTGTSVTVEGVVTAEPYAFYPADELRYYYIQDEASAQSGIKVYDPGRALAEGDEIRITGTVSEYYDMTELESITEFELLSSGNQMDPLIVTLDEDMEVYEGCLIQVQDVSVSNPDLGYGEWSVTDGTDSLILDDAADYYYTPVQSQGLASVTGVLDYSFGAYKLLPRLARDVQTDDGLTRIQAIQQVNYSGLLPHYDGPDSSLYFQDSSYYFHGFTDTAIVTVEGIVTMPTGLSYAGNGVKFIFQDAAGGPWSSILCYDPDSLTFPTLKEGFKIQATGYISEFSTTTDDGNISAMTELFITEDINVLDINQPLPEEPVIKTGDLRWPTTAEQWGNVIVKVEKAKVTANNPTAFDILEVDDGSGSVYIDDDSDSLANYIQPPVGSKYDLIRGWVYHHYGSYADSTTYKLVPLYKSDMLLSTVSAKDVVTPEEYSLSNYPNPFNPSTTIRFNLPMAQQTKLVIYNQLGQQVVSLVDKSLSAGQYELTWSGTDAGGKPVASGLYFYYLLAGNEQLVGKMTFLK